MIRFLRQCIVFVLTWEARLVLARHKPKIIAITGSVGKTTTKDAIYAALSGELHMRKSQKSFNSEIGVPLTILGLENAWNNPLKWLENIVRGAVLVIRKVDYPEWLVLEVGADRPGDIKRIARWLRPDIVVFTGVPEIPAHIEYFPSPESLMREKRSLAEHLKSGGKLILNGDEVRTRELQSRFRGASITYGLNDNNDFHSSHEEVVYEPDIPTGIRFRINRNGASVPISISGALGAPRIYAALAALAVGETVGVDLVAVAKGLAEWTPPPGRVRLIKGVNNSIIIDDTYNSSPSAVAAALDTLAGVKAKRRIAILGDMLELGRYSADAHKKIGVQVAACADMLITVGFRARAIARSALDAGMKDENILQYELGESERAGMELRDKLAYGDIVLVKGSQGIRMEKTVYEIMEDQDLADELLVRMDSEWRHR